MAYIGKTPTIGNFQVCDAISVVNNQAAYTMQVGGVNVSPESANHMLVSLNGVIQKPTDAFTVSGSVITFASNLVTGDVIDFIQILGNVLDLGVPSDSTVSLAKLTATGTKSSSTFLRGDNTFDTPPLGGITEADQWRLTTNFTNSGSNYITSNWERNDNIGYAKLGTGLSESSGVFSFATTGLYYVTFMLWFTRNGNSRYNYAQIHQTQDNSSYDYIAMSSAAIVDNSAVNHMSTVCSTYFNVTNVSTQKLKFLCNSEAEISILSLGSGKSNSPCATFIRLGDAQ